ncbi:MAG: lysophospholipid acyltransferase family protein [Xanthobacteraceae bacterium]|jgi:hypothetical protein
MPAWRNIARQRWAKAAVGVTAAEFLRLVATTSRFVFEPSDIYERLAADAPTIIALWHGQHFLAPVARKIGFRAKVLVSRHHDGEINAVAAERFGVGAIRGSGNHGGNFVHKGGVAAFQAMLDALADGCSVALSADVPKVSRVAGLGIIKLAQASGRPIYAAAFATSRRVVLDNWDRTTINLPFSRGCGVAAEPLSVPAAADAEELEACRRLLEDRLTAVTRRAYEVVDRPHQGA